MLTTQQKSRLMKTAHDAARYWIAAHPADDYRVVFSAALKDAYKVQGRCYTFANEVARRQLSVAPWAGVIDDVVFDFGKVDAENQWNIWGFRYFDTKVTLSSVLINFEEDWVDVELCSERGGRRVLYHRNSEWFEGERGGALPFWGKWTRKEYETAVFRSVVRVLRNLGLWLPCMRFQFTPPAAAA